MHRYRIVAQISLIFSTLNLVFAAPKVGQGIHEAHGNETVVAGDVAAMPKQWRELEAESDRSTSPRSTSDDLASPQHSSSSDGSTSSGYPAPYLSSDSSVSGYSWLLDRPPRLSPGHPASLYDSASPSHPSSSGSTEIPLLAVLQGLAPEAPQLWHIPPWRQVSAPEDVPLPPLWLLQLGPLPHSSSSGSSETPPSPQLTGSDRATTETYSPLDQFTPSHHPLSSTDWYDSDESMSTRYSSASGGSLSSHYFSASDGLVPSYHSMPEGLVPSHHLTPDGSPASPSSPPAETPSGNAEFFNKNMTKKLKIVAVVTIIGGIIAGIAGSQIEHHDYQDSGPCQVRSSRISS